MMRHSRIAIPLLFLVVICTGCAAPKMMLAPNTEVYLNEGIVIPQDTGPSNVSGQLVEKFTAAGFPASFSQNAGYRYFLDYQYHAKHDALVGWCFTNFNGQLMDTRYNKSVANLNFQQGALSWTSDGSVLDGFVEQLVASSSNSGVAPKNPDWPKLGIQESDIIAHADSMGASLDPIEGVWTVMQSGQWRNTSTGESGDAPNSSGDYRLGVVRDSSTSGWGYVVVVLESKHSEWQPGHIKAHLRETAYGGIYECKWFRLDRSEETRTFTQQDEGLFVSNSTSYNGAVEINHNLNLLKVYPKVSGNIAQDKSARPSTGSGFFASKDGLVATNYHVIDGAKRITVKWPFTGKELPAEVVVTDKVNDIAVLRVELASSDRFILDQAPYGLLSQRDYKAGQDIFALGYPLGDLLGGDVKVSKGVISSMSGIQDDPRQIQISAPVQPGNSGGPLFNMDGNVVGLVVATLKSDVMIENTGVAPQNVNFAIKATYLSNLLDGISGVSPLSGPSDSGGSEKLENLVESLRNFVVQVKSN